MPIIALAQQKGGVGKSTAAINLACCAVAAGEAAAIIDMDIEQGTARKWGEKREGKAPVVYPCAPAKLPPLLKRLEAEGVKWVFIDVPGRAASASGAGMSAADFVIVPSRPCDVDIEASLATAQTVIRAGKSYAYLMNIAPPQASKSRAKETAAELINAGYPVIPVIITLQQQVPDAICEGRGVIENGNRKSVAAQEFEALFSWLKEHVK